MQFVTQTFGLAEDTIVITGGAGVLPSAMAKAYLKAGARVVLWGRGTNHPPQEAAKRIGTETDAADRVFAITVDTGSEDQVSKALAETERLAGPPTILVNGVGGNKGKADLVDIDVDLFRELVDMNLVAGLVIPTKVFAKYWIDRGSEGTIINLASMASYVPLSGVWAYDAAKAAVLNLTVGSAKQLASHKIRVNGIAPGFFLGYQNRALLVADDATGELTPRGRQVIDHTPFARFGEYEDLEGVSVFLASRKASGFITGVTIPVDGGYLTHNI